MKKLFAFAITTLAVVAVLSSCKKEEFTDEALINNISTNVTYTGNCVWVYADPKEQKSEDKVNVQFVNTNSTGKVAIVIFESGMLSGEGVWDVKNSVLSLSWTGHISKEVTSELMLTGVISGNGDKFTLTSKNEKGDTVTMDLKKK